MAHKDCIRVHPSPRCARRYSLSQCSRESWKRTSKQPGASLAAGKADREQGCNHSDAVRRGITTPVGNGGAPITKRMEEKGEKSGNVNSDGR